MFPSQEPVAKVHLIFLAKTLSLHSLINCKDNDEALLGHLMLTVAKVCREQDLQGYRIVMNNGKNAHQTIHNLYVDVIGGQ